MADDVIPAPAGRLRVALLVFDDVDLLDVGGPYEVFLTANRLARRAEEPEPYEVVVVSPDDADVHAYGGLRLGPTRRLDDVAGAEVVVVPGAIDIDEIAARPGVREALDRLLAGAKVTASVCTGAFLLARQGLLGDGAFTTHWEDLDSLAAQVGRPQDARRARWADRGRVVTGGAIASGLSMALHLVDRTAGRDLAVRTARQIDVPFDPDDPTFPAPATSHPAKGRPRPGAVASARN